METFAVSRLALVPALALGLYACAQEKTYPVTVEAAQAALVNTEIPGIAFGMSAHSEPAIAIPGGVEWFISRDQSGSEASASPASQKHLLILTAQFDPVSGGTRVAVDVKPGSSAQASAFAKGMEQKPAVAAMFRSIASEQVDATLSHRDFNFANIRQSMALATLSMMPEISNQMDSAAEEFHRADRERVDNAYRAEARGDSPAQDSNRAPPSYGPSR
jgi:hypothetical protein